MEQPPLGLTTTVRLESITDGDTIKVCLERYLTIRLIDDEVYFDAPETYRPKSDEEEEFGEAVEKRLAELLYKEEDGKLVQREIVLHIPTDGENRMQDVTTLSRFNGQIWADGVDVVDELVKFMREYNK